MKVALWISFYFMTFLGLIAGMYLSKETIVQETQDMPILNQTGFHQHAATIDSTSLHLVDSLSFVMEGMLDQMGAYVRKIHQRDSTIESLKAELTLLYKEREGLMADIEALREANKEKIDQEKELQDLAKTLGSMKLNVLGPILANLPDDIVRILYHKARAKDRSKILNALPPKRAGQIMRKITGRAVKKVSDAK